MNLNIYYQNVRGLRTKVHDFYTSVLSSDFELIAVTESWLYDGINNEELFDNRYEVYRKDRNLQKTMKKIGGGVVLAIDKKFNSKLVPLNCNEDSVELLCIKINMLPKPLLVCIVYVPRKHILIFMSHFFIR